MAATTSKGAQLMVIDLLSLCLKAQKVPWTGFIRLSCYTAPSQQFVHLKEVAFPGVEHTALKWYVTQLNTKSQMGTGRLGWILPCVKNADLHQQRIWCTVINRNWRSVFQLVWILRYVLGLKPFSNTIAGRTNGRYEQQPHEYVKTSQTVF